MRMQNEMRGGEFGLTENNLTQGRTEISEEVISKIAGIAAMECFGVVGMASRKISDGIAELLRKENLTKGVQVKIDEGKVVLDLFLIVAYGIKISEMAVNVQEKVKFNVENMTGMKVENVNIHIQGVRVDAEE